MHIVKEPGKRHGHWRLTPKGEIRYDRAAQRRPVVAVPETPAAPAKVQRPPYPKDLAAEFTRILGADDEKLVGAVYRNGEVHWADAMQFPQTLRTKQNPPQPDPEHAALQRAMGLLALYARYTLGDQLQGTRAMPVEAIRRIAAVYPNASDAMKPIERLRHPNTDFTDVAEILEGVKGRDKLARALIPILYPLDAMPKREPIPVKPNALAGRDYPHEPGLDRLAERLATIRGVRPNEIDGMVREARAQVVLTISKPFASRANAVIDRWVELGYAPGAPGADLQAAADEWVAAHRDAAVPYGKEATEAARATIAAAHDAYRASGATTFGAWVTSLPHLPFGPDQATVTRETEGRAKRGLGLIPAVHPSLHDRIKGQRVNIVGASHPAADYASRATYFKGDAQAARENKGYPASPHIVVFPESSPDVVAHEYGHHLGAALGVLPILRAWVLSRATGAPKKLGPPYDSTELAYPDTFAHRYVGATTISGRHFSENANTEVLSMGVQYLAIDPDRFYQMDPDHALLTVGLLQGMNPAAPQAKPLGKSEGEAPPRNWPAEVPWRPFTNYGESKEIRDALSHPSYRVHYVGAKVGADGARHHHFEVHPAALDPEQHEVIPGERTAWYDKRVGKTDGRFGAYEPRNGWQDLNDFQPEGHAEGDLYRGIGGGGYRAMNEAGVIRGGRKGGDLYGAGEASTYYAPDHTGAIPYVVDPDNPHSAPRFDNPRYLLHIKPPSGTAVARQGEWGEVSTVKGDLPLSAVHAAYEVRPYRMEAGHFALRETKFGTYHPGDFSPLSSETAIRKVAAPRPVSLGKSEGDEAPPRNWPKKLPHLPLSEGLIASGASDFLDSPHWRVRYAGTEPSPHTGADQHILHVVPRSLDPKRHKALPDATLPNGTTVPSWYDSAVASPPRRPGEEPQPRAGWEDSTTWDPGEHPDTDLWRGLGSGGYKAFRDSGTLGTNGKGADAYNTGGATYYARQHYGALTYAEQPTERTAGAQFDRPRYLLHVKPPEGADVQATSARSYAVVPHDLPASAVHATYEVRPHVMRAGRLALRPIDTPEGKRYHVTHWAAPESDHVVGPVSAPIEKSVGEPVATQPPNWPAGVDWKPMHQFGYGKQAMAVLHDPGRKIVHHDSYKHGDATVHLFDIVPQGIDPARHTPDLDDPNDDPADAKVWYDHTMVTPTEQPHGAWRKWEPKDGWQHPRTLSMPEHQDGDLWRGVGHGGYRAMRETGVIRTEHKGDDVYNTGGATYYATGPHNAAVYADEPTDPLHNATFVRPRYLLHIRPPEGTEVTRHPDSGGYASVKGDLPASAVVGTHEVRPYKLHAGNFAVREHNGTFHVTDFNDLHGVNFVKKIDPPAALAKGWYGEKEDEAPRNWPGDLPWKPLSPRGYAGNDIMRSLNSPHHRVEYVGSRETLQGATAHQFRVLPGVIDPARHKEFKHEPGRFYDSKISTDPGDGIFPNHKPRGGWQALEDFDPQGHEQGDLWRGIGHGGYQAFRADGMLATSHKGGDRYDSGGATYYGTTPGEAASYASNPTDFLAHAQFHRPRYLLHIRPPEGADVRYHAAGSVATLGTPIPESAVKATYEVRPYAMRSGNFTLHEEPDGTYHPADYNEPTVQNAIKKVATPKVKPLGKSAGEDDPAAEPPPNQWPAEVPWKGIHWGGHRDAAINYLNSPHWQVRHRGTRETAEGVKEHVFDIMPGHLDPERHIPLDPSKRMWYDREIAQPGGGHAGGYAVSPANGWELTSRFAPTDHRDGDLWRGIGYNGHKALMASGALQTSSKGADQYGAGKGQTYYGTDHDAAMYYAEYPTDALNQPQFHRPRYLLHVRPPQGTQATIQDKKYAIATVGDQMPLSAIHSTYELRPYALSAGSLTMRETPEGPYRATEYRPPESYVAIKKVGGAAPGGLAKSFQAPPAPSMDLPIDGDHPNWPTGLPKTVRLDPGYSIVANHMKTGTTRLSATDATQENEEYYGKGHRWRVTVDPHLDPALHGVVPGREPDSADPYVAGRAQWYDRELAEAKPDDDWNSMGLDQRHKVVPTVGKAEGWHDEIPAEKEDGYIYRGMSAGELRAAATNGGFASRGEHNIGDVQKGLTYFADDPKDAGSYATSFAPSGYKPTFGHPGYVVKLKNPGGDREVRLPHIPGEVGIRGAIPHHQIEQVYEARPYAVERGQSEIVSDGRTKDPIHQDGSGRGASSRVLWRTAHPSEFFGGPQPIQKSDAPATPWRYEEADPKRQPHRELRQHIDAALRYAHENYADMTGLRIKRGTDSPTAIMSTAQGRDGASLAYNPALTRNMATLRGHLATASQQDHHHALTPEGVAWHEVGHLVRNAHPEGYRVAGRIHSGVIDRLEDGRLSEARGHAVLGKYALHSNAETFSELYRLHHTTGLPADFAWAGPHIDSLRRGAPAVQKSGGPTITHHEDEFGSYRKVDGATDINGNWKRLERLHDDDEVLLHHATKTEHAQSILRDGWKANSGATNYTNSSPQHVYMGDRRSLGTYVGQKGGNHPALLAVAVKKRDLEPDLGSDWNAHARTNKRDLKARGIDAKAPTAIHTYAEINQVRAPHQTVRPLGYQDYHSGEEFWHQRPVQKSGDPATDPQRLARTPWPGDRVQVNAPGRRDHGATYTVGHVGKTGVTLNDATGTPASQLGGEAWHQRVTAGEYTHVAPGLKPLRAGADFSQPIPRPAPRPRKEPPPPTDGPMPAADWESGQPGTYRGYRASRPQYMNTGAVNGAVYVGHTGDDAAGYHTAGNELHQVEFDVQKPFDIQAPGNAEALAGVNRWGPKPTQAEADEYRRMGVMEFTPAQRQWLVGQGYDAVLTNPQHYPLPGVERAMALLHRGKLRTIKKIAHRDDVEAALRGHGKPAHAKQAHHYPMLVRDLDRELGKSATPEEASLFWRVRDALVKSEVREPGKRGGKFWRDGKGHVRYGKQPGLRLGVSKEALFGANQLTPKEDLKAIPAQVRAAIGHLYGDESGLGRNFASDTYARVELADRNKTRLFEALASDIKRAGQHPDQPPSYADSAFRGMLDQVSLLYDPEEYRVNHTNPGESEMWTAPFQEKHDQLVAIVRRALYDDPAALVEAGKALLASGRTPVEAAPGSEIAAHRERIRATVAAARDEFNTVGQGSPARWLALTRHDESDWADKWVKMSRMDEDDTEQINLGLASIPLAKHYLVALEGSERPAIAWERYKRSHYDPKQRMVRLDDDWTDDVAAHEYAHHLERQLGLGPLLTTWVQDRATGAQMPLGAPYGPGENAHPDRFYNRYIGKLYGEVEGQPMTEALSMGVHALAVDPQAFYEADPEHFLLTMGLLQGLGGGGVAKSEDVKEPGSRGGKFWRDKTGRVRYGKEPSWRGPTLAVQPQAVIPPTRGSVIRSLSLDDASGAILSPKAKKAIRAVFGSGDELEPSYLPKDTDAKRYIDSRVDDFTKMLIRNWVYRQDPNDQEYGDNGEGWLKRTLDMMIDWSYRDEKAAQARIPQAVATLRAEVFAPKAAEAMRQRYEQGIENQRPSHFALEGVDTRAAREVLRERLNAAVPDRHRDGNRVYQWADAGMKGWADRKTAGDGWRERVWKQWQSDFAPWGKKTVTRQDAAHGMATWTREDPNGSTTNDKAEIAYAEAKLRKVLDGWADDLEGATARADAHYAAAITEVHDRAAALLAGEGHGSPLRWVGMHQPKTPARSAAKLVSPFPSTYTGHEDELADQMHAIGLIPMAASVRARLQRKDGKIPPMRRLQAGEGFGGDRSFYSGVLEMTPQAAAQVAAHEYGHHIEVELHAAPLLHRWMRGRASGQRAPLGAGYDDSEIAYPDAFVNRYVGKDYSISGEVMGEDRVHVGATEVLSLGVEALVTEPEKFYKADPEHFLLTMGVLLDCMDEKEAIHPVERFEGELSRYAEARRTREAFQQRRREALAASDVAKSGDVKEPGKRGSTRWWRTPAGQVRYGERPSAPAPGLPMTETEREGHTKDLIQPWNNLTPPTPYAAIPPKVERAINRLFQAPAALNMSDPTMCRAFKNFAMQTLLRVAEPGGDRALDHSRQEFRRNIETTMRAFDPERWAKARPGWTQERAIQELCDLADAEVYDNLPALRKRIERARKPEQPRHSRPVSRDDRGLWDALEQIAQRHLGLAGVTMNRANTDAFMACRMVATRGMTAWEDAERWPDQHAVDAATGAGYRALYADPEQHDARGEALRLTTGVNKGQMMPILHAIYTEWAGWIDKGDKAVREGERKRRAKLVAAARKRCEKETGGDLAAFVEKYAIGEQVAWRQVSGYDPPEAIDTDEWPTLIAGMAAIPLGAPVLDLLQRRQRARVRRGDSPRSSYTPGGRPRLNMGAGFTADVAAHEFAHHVEQVCGWGKIVRPWVLDRAESPAQHLGYQYEKDEEAYPDHFMNRYVGKEYGERHGSTEVISVGVQALVLDPVAFERADAEHCWLTLALLLGLGMDDVAKSFDPAGGHPDQRPQASPEEADANLHRWSAGSVLNHSSGHPMTFYHGTPRAFTSFDPRKLGQNTRIADAYEGFFFGATPEIADHYTNFLGRNKPDATPNIMPVHLNAKRLLYTSLGHSLPATQIRAAIRMAHKHECEGVAILSHYPEEAPTGGGRHVGNIRQRGGAIPCYVADAPEHVPWSGEKGWNGDSVAVFHPHQIKSAIGNSGHYDPTDPHMGKSFDTTGGHPDQRPQASPEEAGANLASFMAGAHKIALNSDGTPRTFYHGTRANFGTFRPSESGSFGPGMYFTSHKGYANIFAGEGEGANVIPAHLAIRNPYVTPKGLLSPAKVKQVFDKGHDAIVQRHPRWPDEMTLMVRHPHQIKSAIGNSGHYDPTDPHLGKSEDVQHPGARGGRYWRDGKGHVRYGAQPGQQVDPSRVPAVFKKDNLQPAPPSGLVPSKLVEQMRQLAAFGPEGEKTARAIGGALADPNVPEGQWEQLAELWASGLRQHQERVIYPEDDTEEDREHRKALELTVRRGIAALRKKFPLAVAQEKLADLQHKNTPRAQFDYADADRLHGAIIAAARADFEEETAQGGNVFTWVEKHALGEEEARRLLGFPEKLASRYETLYGLPAERHEAVVRAVAAIPVGAAVLERLHRAGEVCNVMWSSERSSYFHESRAIKLQDDTAPDVAAHEFGHFIERTLGWGATLHDWVTGRATGQQVPLGRGYNENEKAYPDTFIGKYVGKVYEDRYGMATEVLSVGIQATQISAGAFRATDRDHLFLVLGLLLGLGPDPRPTPA